MTTDPQLPAALSKYVGSNRGDHASVTGVFGTNVLSQRLNGERGMFFGDSKVRIRDLTDSTSSTIMVGERAWSYQTGSAKRE